MEFYDKTFDRVNVKNERPLRRIDRVGVGAREGDLRPAAPAQPQAQLVAAPLSTTLLGIGTECDISYLTSHSCSGRLESFDTRTALLVFNHIVTSTSS